MSAGARSSPWPCLLRAWLALLACVAAGLCTATAAAPTTPVLAPERAVATAAAPVMAQDGAVATVVAAPLMAQDGAPATAAAPLLVLNGAAATIDVREALTWTGAADAATTERALAGTLPFAVARVDALQRLGRGNAIWISLRVQATAREPDDWVLEIPMPLLDEAVVYQRDARGAWVRRMAGDGVPMQAWPEAGRFPFFRLALAGAAPQQILLRVRHGNALALPLRLVTGAEHYRRTLLEYLLLGLVLGGLGLLVAASAWRAWALRDVAHAWYAAFALLAMGAMGAYTGVAAHLAWGNAGLWVDAAPGVLALVAAGAALLVVAQLTALASRAPRLGGVIVVTGWMGALVAAAYLLLERRMGVALLGFYVVVVAALSLWAAILTWRRGDPVGRWLVVGSAPLALAVLLALARVFSLVEPSWATEYGVVIALMMNLPMLLGALNNRSVERRGARLRQLAAGSQDPLTGLPRGQAFGARLAHALRRHATSGESAAIAIVEVANLPWIQQSLGDGAAEESLLRAVITLRRLVRDVDTTCRIGDRRFGLILEGVATREAVSAIGSRLVAAGLIREPGHQGEPELEFHIAAVVLREHSGAVHELVRGLGSLLERMPARTHRPVRFYDPQGPASQPATDVGNLRGTPDPG